MTRRILALGHVGPAFTPKSTMHTKYRRLIRKPPQGLPPSESGVSGWSEREGRRRLTNSATGEIDTQPPGAAMTGNPAGITKGAAPGVGVSILDMAYQECLLAEGEESAEKWRADINWIARSLLGEYGLNG